MMDYFPSFSMNKSLMTFGVLGSLAGVAEAQDNVPHSQTVAAVQEEQHDTVRILTQEPAVQQPSIFAPNQSVISMQELEQLVTQAVATEMDKEEHQSFTDQDKAYITATLQRILPTLQRDLQEKMTAQSAKQEAAVIQLQSQMKHLEQHQLDAQSFQKATVWPLVKAALGSLCSLLCAYLVFQYKKQKIFSWSF